jgi:hypothetical protein
MFSAVLLLGLIGLFTGCRTAVPRTPEGDVKSQLKVKLTGKEVAVDLYLPQGLKKAPVVVVAHGFSRSRSNMAGWGGLLASNGFIAAIPDLPSWSDHERNSVAIRELLDRLNSRDSHCGPLSLLTLRRLKCLPPGGTHRLLDGNERRTGAN